MSSTEISTFRMTRRQLLRGAAGGTACVLGLGGGVNLLNECWKPRVSRVTVPLPSLPSALDGFRICQLSDLHRGRIVSEAFVREGVALAGGLNADLIVVTGDFISDSSRYASSCGAALSGLRAPHGVYGVMGNHDYWNEDAEAVQHAVESAGVRFLTNRSHRISARGAEWWLCGVDDLWSGTTDLNRALADVPAGAFRILLCHEPDFADTAAAAGVPLQLSGHSHGGQVRLSSGRALHLPRFGRKYPAGLQRVPRTQTLVYTNVGLGVTTLPVRLNCPPEVTLLTLKKA